MQRGSLKIKKNRHGVKVWQAQWRENGQGRSRYLGNYADVDRGAARAELDRILESVQGVTPKTVSGAITIQRFIEDEYLVAKTRKWKASTRVTTEQIINAHIVEGLGNDLVCSVNRKRLQSHLDALAASDLSYSVVAHARWQLEAIFTMAVADGLLRTNPASGLEIPNCKAALPKRTMAVEDFIRAQMALGIRERLIFRLAFSEGLRPGEIVGLQIGDFAEDGAFQIRRRIYRGIVDTPKSKKSVRKFPMTDPTWTLAKTWIELMGTSDPSAWLFPSENPKTPISYPNVFRRSIQPALAKIGLGNVNFQILRRSCATQMSAIEKDPVLRAQIMGHGVDVHENEYRQADQEALKVTMKNMGDRLQ